MAEENGYNQYDPSGTTIEDLMARLVQLQSRISSTISEVRREDGKLSEKQSQISQDVDSIKLEVYASDGTTSRISSLEVRAGSIESEVFTTGPGGTQISRIDQNANEISQKVASSDYNGQTIASLINQTASTITLSAEAIDLNGITHVYKTLTIGDGAAQDAGIIFNGSDSSIGTRLSGLEISSAGDLYISSVKLTFASTTTVDFSGAKAITWGSNAPPPPTSVSYATNSGNADTLDNYHASAFSLSGHDHGSAYIRPYTGQNLYLWRSGSEVRVYDGSGAYTKLTGTAF